jgi:hypothetical protein
VALRQEHMARIHNHIVEMEHALKNNDPPVFALIMMSKVSISFEEIYVAKFNVKIFDKIINFQGLCISQFSYRLEF